MTEIAGRKYFCKTFKVILLNLFLSFDESSGIYRYKWTDKSQYSHAGTIGMANYREKALTTGCWDSGGCAVKTELMIWKL